MFGEKNQTLVYEGCSYGGAGDRRSLWGCDLENGVVCRASLFEHNNIAADYGAGKCRL